MASKKFTLLAILVMGAAASGLCQLGGVLDYLDSTKVSSKKLPQYNEWKNNSKTNYFPPKPKSMGQLSLNGGLFVVDGDASLQPGWNLGLSYRKALGYVVSYRVGVNYATSTGIDYRKNGNLGNSQVLVNTYSVPQGPGWYVHSYKTNAWIPSLDLLFNLNNVMFHKNKSKFALYGLIGYSPVIYKTDLDALRGSGAYNFASLNNDFFARDRKEIRSDLKDFFDGDFETPANVNDRSPNFNQNGPDNYQIRHSVNFGFGTEFRIATRWSLGAEFKYQMTFDDYIDGWFLNNGSLTTSKDNLIYTNLFINYNL
ncbi:MAG TPA: hypothetical protein VLC98_08545 [Phnomibacter sp.]|nr:hypothetical protein [Phnomibacter sp.]